MSWNGVGTFNRIFSWVADKNANIDITASRMDTDTNDITSNGFGNCLTRDGQGSATANLPMNSFRHTGAGNGVALTDYATMGQLQGGSIVWAVATGTADALAASYSPSIAALVDGQLCFVRAAAANATTTPTFSPSGLTAHTITKLGGAALAIGDIAGAGHEMILRYKLASTRWELLNPATVAGTTFWCGAAGGTGIAITVNDANFNLQDGYQLSFRATANNSGATTIAVSGGSAIAVVKDTTAGPIALTGSEIETGNIVTLIYDLNASEFHISAPLTLIGSAQLLSSALSFCAPINLGLFADNVTAGANLLFVALKGANGSDPSPTNPVLIPFRNATATIGTPTFLTITSALSIDTHATGATLASVANAAFRFWIGCFNNAGTPQLALQNCLSPVANAPQIFALNDRVAQSSTPISSGATSAGVWYTQNGVTVSSKEVCILGYVEYNSTGLVTPGTYATAPNFLQMAGPNTPRPGQEIQRNYVGLNSTASIAGTGTQAFATATGLSAPIIPTSAANPIEVSGTINTSVATGSTTAFARLSRASTGIAIGAAGGASQPQATVEAQPLSVADCAAVSMLFLDVPNTASSATYNWQVSSGNTFAVTINEVSNDSNTATKGRFFSYIQAREIMA